jgi:hypothetical protein
METAKLRIVADTAPPKIIALATPEALGPCPINRGAVQPRRVLHLDVDGILARSLPKVAKSFEKVA